jgi:peptidyl-tRNA hydrolase, PTH1 family
MKLIVGLGNPGRKYRETRHNIGFGVVDELAARHGVSFESAPAEALLARARLLGAGGTLLVKPLTMMNLSGFAVTEIARYFRIDTADIFVVADDVNLPLGRLRARSSGSAGGHNGFRSIIEQLGTNAFARLRVGVGRGDPRRNLADYVLAGFDADERPVVGETIGRAADASELFVAEGVEAVMNRYNGPADDEGSGGTAAGASGPGAGSRKPDA